MAAVDGRIGTDIMPGVFAQIGMEYGHRYGSTSFELFAQIRQKNHSHSTLNPMAAYQKKMSLDEIMNDVMIAYPDTASHVLGQLRRRGCGRGGCSGSKLKTLLAGAAEACGEDHGVDPDHRPVGRGIQILPNVNDLTRNAAAQAYEQAGVGSLGFEPGGAARLLRHGRTGALQRPLGLCEQRCGRASSVGVQPGATARLR